MLAFIQQNLATILISTVLLLFLALVLRYLIRKVKSGGCAGCSGCDKPASAKDSACGGGCSCCSVHTRGEVHGKHTV